MAELKKVTMPKPPEPPPAKKAVSVNLGQKQKVPPKRKAISVNLGTDRPTRNAADRKKSPY